MLGILKLAKHEYHPHPLKHNDPPPLIPPLKITHIEALTFWPHFKNVIPLDFQMEMRLLQYLQIRIRDMVLIQ